LHQLLLPVGHVGSLIEPRMSYQVLFLQVFLCICIYGE